MRQTDYLNMKRAIKHLDDKSLQSVLLVFLEHIKTLERHAESIDSILHDHMDNNSEAWNTQIEFNKGTIKFTKKVAEFLRMNEINEEEKDGPTCVVLPVFDDTEEDVSCEEDISEDEPEDRGGETV